MNNYNILRRYSDNGHHHILNTSTDFTNTVGRDNKIKRKIKMRSKISKKINRK